MVLKVQKNSLIALRTIVFNNRLSFWLHIDFDGVNFKINIEQTNLNLVKP